MLDALRSAAKTWVAKVLLALLIGSFAIWGINDAIVGLGADTAVAEVGDTEIEASRFQQAYTRQLQALTRQFGTAIDAETAYSLGLPQQVLAQLIRDAALADVADSLGVGISDEALARAIAEDPTLRPEGAETFNRAYFNQLLRDNNLTEEAYVADRRVEEARRQVTEALVGGATTPTALLEALNRYRSDIRAVDYVVLERSAVEPVPAPTEEQLATWFEANKAGFQAPEYRKIEVISVTPDALADPSAVDDETVRAQYERSKAAYGTPERRRIEQILFPSIDEAQAAAAAITAGSTFEAVAAEQGLSPSDIDLGLVERSDIIDPAVAEAAFTLQEGDVSPPIAARFGGALVRVAEIQPESVRAFEEVANEIRREIALRNADALVLDAYDEIEDARAGGATLREIAERFKLPLRTVEVDETGQTPTGETVTDLPARERILAEAFESEVGVENDPVQVDRRGYAWFDVTGVTPVRDRELSEVRDEVVSAWTETEAQELLAARADEIAEAVRGGKPLSEVAADAGLAVRSVENLTRNASPPEIGPAAVEAAYGGPEGHVATTEAPTGGRMVLVVTDSLLTPYFPEAADTITAAERFGEEIEDSLLTLYVTDLQAALGTTMNLRVLENAIGLTGR